MPRLEPYSYVVLRYRHDPLSEEFINIGVVVYSAPRQFVKFKGRATVGRITAFFPDVDRDAYRQTLRSVRRAFITLAKRRNEGDMFAAEDNASLISHRLLPADDSALQWSRPGAGLSADLNATLAQLFHRMVARYDPAPQQRRSDAEVWKTLRERLESRSIEARLGEKTISGAIDKIEFKHAWKNGRWHCLQPLSFDLADGEGIRDKARKWTGHLAAVSDAGDEFTPYFFLAAPSRSDLFQDFNNAVAILKTSSVEPMIYMEHQVEDLVDNIERQIIAHDQRMTASMDDEQNSLDISIFEDPDIH